MNFRIGKFKEQEHATDWNGFIENCLDIHAYHIAALAQFKLFFYFPSEGGGRN